MPIQRGDAVRLRATRHTVQYWRPALRKLHAEGAIGVEVQAWMNPEVVFPHVAEHFWLRSGALEKIELTEGSQNAGAD